MSDIAVAHDYLEACKTWQTIINAEGTMDGKQAAGRAALEGLKNQTFHDTRRVIVGGEAALYLPDGTSGLEEQIWPLMQFGEVVTRGWLGRLNFVALGKEAFLDWAIYDPSVIGPISQEEIDGTTPDDPAAAEILHALKIDQTQKRALHFPVGLINFAICYGR